MDKLKRYIECYIDTETCNLRCHYCYIALLEKFNKKLVNFAYSTDTIVKALSKERLGGTCLFNFCAGGETLLSPEVLPVVRGLLEEGHYAMVVTNGTITERFKEISRYPKELTKRLIFKFSFHYLELKRLGWLERFFENIELVREAGASFTVEITPNDELIPYIDEIKRICIEKLGTYCHFTIARDDRTNGIEVLSKHDWESYKKIWGVFQSELFDFKTSIFYVKRKEFCYAGDWSVWLNLSTGCMSQCYCGVQIDNIYQNIEKPLHFEAIGCNCELAHCYNGHAFLTLGDIPGLDTVRYAEVRNKTDNQGREWIQPEMKVFISQKLYDNNEEYSIERKKEINRKNKRKLTLKRNVKKVVKFISIAQHK